MLHGLTAGDRRAFDSGASGGEDLAVPHAGVAFEADMSREQADRLAQLMADARPTRPEGVLSASLEFHDGRARLVAIWRDAATLARYLAEAPVPRGTELMRKVGVEPAVTRFEILDLG
jgi:hypothetical protein